MGGGGIARRLSAIAARGLACGIMLASAPLAQLRDDPHALNAEAARLYTAGKYAEAIEIAKRSLAILENALGPEHLDVGAQRPIRARPEIRSVAVDPVSHGIPSGHAALRPLIGRTNPMRSLSSRPPI
jgi:hypothetical protein